MAFQAKAADLPFSPTASRVLQTIFDDGLISTYFDSQISSVAHHYARRTHLAGKIRVNDTPSPGALHIYVFRYSDTLPIWLRNNCHTFAHDAVILCDHALLDSVPSALPVEPEGAKRIAESGLLYWLIGHEIGHVLLSHDRSAFGADAVDDADAIVDAVSDQVISALNEQELDADRFAVTALPADHDSQWIFFAVPIADAILWELSRAGAFNAAGTDANRDAFRITIKTGPTSHPPMIVRLYGIVQTIRDVYGRFPQASGMIPKVQFAVERVPSLESTVADESNLFFGGAYLGSDHIPASATHAALDRALYFQLAGEPHLAAGLLRVACDAAVGPSEVWRMQRELLCPSERRMTSKESFALLSSCTSLPKDERARCYALLSAVALRCVTNVEGSRRPSACSDPARLNSIDARYGGEPFDIPAQLNPWLLWGRYLYARDVLQLSAEVLDDWLYATIRMQLESKSVVDQDLLAEHHKFVSRSPTDAQSSRMLQILSAQAELAAFDGNDVSTIHWRKQVIAFLEKNDPQNYAALGFNKQRLGRAMREFQMASTDRNESVWFLNLMENEQRMKQSEETRAQAGPVFDSAFRDFRSIFDEAFAKQDQEAMNSSFRSMISSLNEGLLSYNFVADDAKALSSAALLMKILELIPGESWNEEMEVKLLLPALENCSSAHIAAVEGDGKLALEYAQRALKIREAHDSDPTLPLRLLAQAQFRLGDKLAASATLSRYVREFNQLYQRRSAATMGSVRIGGQLIELESLLIP